VREHRRRRARKSKKMHGILRGGGRAQYGDTVGRSVAAISGPYHLSIGQLSLVTAVLSVLENLRPEWSRRGYSK
jgi:hypothetical protein